MEYGSTAKKLGKAIRHFRMKKGITQQQAADAYGCSLRWWQMLEKGMNVSVDVLGKIGKTVGVEPWRLLK